MSTLISPDDTWTLWAIVIGITALSFSDEPTAMLDPNGRKEVIKTVRRLQKTKKSNGDPDHPLYGRSDRGRSGICYG